VIFFRAQKYTFLKISNKNLSLPVIPRGGALGCVSWDWVPARNTTRRRFGLRQLGLGYVLFGWICFFLFVIAGND